MSNLLKALKAKQSELSKSGIDVDVARSTIPLDEIADRSGGDTRPLNLVHVEDLVESITLLGLIEPLVVDSQNRLLAGSHRRAAISHIRKTDPEAFEKRFPEGVPVHRLGFDAELQPDLAIQVEVAENEQRRDYTPAEVRAIADRFLEAGHQGRGRPGKGKKALLPALSAVIGKSTRTVQRYLASEEENLPKNTTDVVISQKYLRQAHKAMRLWLQKREDTLESRLLEEELANAMQAIEVFLGGGD